MPVPTEPLDPAKLTDALVDSNTLRKAQQLAADRGMRLSGFILTDEHGRRALVELGAVRWVDNAGMWDLMHPAPCAPPVG